MAVDLNRAIFQLMALAAGVISTSGTDTTNFGGARPRR